MQEDKTGIFTPKTKEDKLINKPLHEKVKEAISKDEEFLNKIIKAISNPVVLLIALPLLYFFWTKYEKTLPKEQVKIKENKVSAKLMKKNKNLKKKIKQMSLKGSGTLPIALIR